MDHSRHSARRKLLDDHETHAQVTHLGGRRYGDGEIVVDFQNVGSTQAPLTAVAVWPDGRAYEGRFTVSDRPSIALAARMIKTVRAHETRRRNPRRRLSATPSRRAA
jgi:hypothetical protein